MRLCVALLFSLPARIEACGIDFGSEVGGRAWSGIGVVVLYHRPSRDVGSKRTLTLSVVLVRGSPLSKETGHAQVLRALRKVALRQARNLVGVGDGFTLGHGSRLHPRPHAITVLRHARKARRHRFSDHTARAHAPSCRALDTIKWRIGWIWVEGARAAPVFPIWPALQLCPSSNLILELLKDDADGWRRIVDDPRLMPNAVEEGLRDASSVVAWRRVALQDVEIAGVEIPQGAPLLLSLASANRDEDHVSNGERFDISRRNARQHTTFGNGTHFCVGAPLARLEMRIILEELSKAFPNMRLAQEEEIEWVKTISFRGPKSLSVTIG